MKKIDLVGLNESVFYEKLNNDLDVYIMKKENFNTFSAYFITKYGALYNEFIPIGESNLRKFPDGIAHFLEHKLFEQESGPSVMEKFSELGIYCNAFTNYLNTAYYISGTDNFYEGLNFLLDYVQSPYFTFENVEKEKGIILQELLMTKDNPYREFIFRKLKNLFKNLNYGDYVLGEEKDIKSIQKDDLYKCYNTFYNPSNMALIIVTNKDENEVLEKIKLNQDNKKFQKQKKIDVKLPVEKNEVRNEYDVFYGNISKSEVSYSIKLNINDFNVDVDKLEIYLYILLVMNFGKITGFGLDLKEKDMINKNISIDSSLYNDYIILSLQTSSNNPEEVVKIIENKFNNMVINKEYFEIVKNSIISNFVYYFTSVPSIMNYLYNDFYYYGKIKGDKFKKYKDLNYEEFSNIFSILNFDNKSITIMKPNEEKE